jgi:Fe-S-cluster containining protein
MTRRQPPAELVYTSATLKGAAAQMPQRDREMARDCFEHWRRECKRIGPAEPERVAFTVHELIDERMQRMRATSEPHVTCSKGCAACCHLNVGIFPQEAELLLLMAREDGIEIDEARLARQATKDDSTWHELSPEDRACVFLGDDRTCRVYEHRPGACRKYLVKNDPDLCDMNKHPGGAVAVVFSVEAEIVHSAAMTVYGAGNMAAMLLRTREKRS